MQLKFSLAQNSKTKSKDIKVYKKSSLSENSILTQIM